MCIATHSERAPEITRWVLASGPCDLPLSGSCRDIRRQDVVQALFYWPLPYARHVLYNPLDRAPAGLIANVPRIKDSWARVPGVMKMIDPDGPGLYPAKPYKRLWGTSRAITTSSATSRPM